MVVAKNMAESIPSGAGVRKWIALAAAALTVWLCLHFARLPREQAFMAGILTLAAVLWVTEAIPLFATSLIIIAAEVFLLANPGGWSGLGFAERPGITYGEVLQAAAAPVLALFFAGFVMARAAVKEGVDRALVSLFLKPFLGTRRRLMFGVMGVTAVFSMWMSNTATAALMLTLTAPLLLQLPPGDPFRKALLLAVAFTANIGGLPTPVSSPPNAIAISHLQRAGVPLGFLDWMMAGLPLMTALLLFTGFLLLKIFRSDHPLPPFTLHPPVLTRRAGTVITVFAITVPLWATEDLHGVPAAAVALLPVVALLFSGILEREDIRMLEWDVLLLIAVKPQEIPGTD